MVTKGYFALVLHAHLPYVRHRNILLFGRKWLFEALTETYLPYSKPLCLEQDKIDYRLLSPFHHLSRHVAG